MYSCQSPRMKKWNQENPWFLEGILKWKNRMFWILSQKDLTQNTLWVENHLWSFKKNSLLEDLRKSLSFNLLQVGKQCETFTESHIQVKKLKHWLKRTKWKMSKGLCSFWTKILFLQFQTESRLLWFSCLKLMMKIVMKNWQTITGSTL